MAPGDRLEEYRDKRSRGSGEPRGGRRRSRRDPIFVVQRHDASTLHFDFRLEIDGVLVSWAVPKGPSLDPREKRLATRTEDHPLEYADFEGVIPEDEYGGGTVIVWDTGPFTHLTERDGKRISAADALEAGHLKFGLEGKKLSGAFALTHSRMRGDERNWLLVKVDDEHADRRRRPTSTQNESVLSGRTNEELAGE